VLTQYENSNSPGIPEYNRKLLAPITPIQHYWLLSLASPKPIILHTFMITFLGIPLEEITASGNKALRWEGIVGDLIISVSAKRLSEERFNYIVYVDLCGFPEKWWPSNRFKLAEASGENIRFLEIDIRRQLKRLQVNF
jgi:hypothetical protein